MGCPQVGVNEAVRLLPVLQSTGLHLLNMDLYATKKEALKLEALADIAPISGREETERGPAIYEQHLKGGNLLD